MQALNKNVSKKLQVQNENGMKLNSKKRPKFKILMEWNEVLKNDKFKMKM